MEGKLLEPCSPLDFCAPLSLLCVCGWARVGVERDKREGLQRIRAHPARALSLSISTPEGDREKKTRHTQGTHHTYSQGGRRHTHGAHGEREERDLAPSLSILQARKGKKRKKKTL